MTIRTTREHLELAEDWLAKAEEWAFKDRAQSRTCSDIAATHAHLAQVGMLVRGIEYENDEKWVTDPLFKDLHEPEPGEPITSSE